VKGIVNGFKDQLRSIGGSDSTEPIFFVDWCLGRRAVPEALRQSGARCELHGDHFESNCPDNEWILAVSARQWIILTKDKRIRRRSTYLEDLRKSRAAAFILTSGNTTGSDNAQAFSKALTSMISLVRTRTRPLIATVSTGGKISIIEGVRRGSVRRP
jgi:hypothetical protein